jgi:dihydrofolate reductase
MTTKASIGSDSSLIQGTVFIALTVDGLIATPDGGVEFLDKFHPDPNAPPRQDDNEEDELGFVAFMRTVDCLVMGRKTFEKVLSFGKEMWGYGETPVIVWSRNPNKTADLIPDHLQKTVSCSSLPPAQLFAELNAKKGYKRVYIDGGTTIRQFLAADLIDEMILTRVPILLGQGIPLFGDDSTNDDDATAAADALQTKKRAMIHMKHMVTKAYPSGLVTTKYQIIKADWQSS